MSGSPNGYPELIAGPNPLLEAAAPFMTVEDLPAALTRRPLAGLDWRSVAPAHRPPLLRLYEQHYCPTRFGIDIAESLQLALRGGLMERNPLSVKEQRRINSLALTDRLKDAPLHSLRVRADGGIISGITGIGKTALVQQVLEAIAPQQIVLHSRSETCGWSSLTQVLYLIIDAPFNGTRGGLLARIAEGFDLLLGTDYSNTLRKLRNLDASLLFVTKLLSIHRVGMLVIDENQQQNLDESIWRNTFILFYLGLMNLGIPVLLLGNPLAFVGLKTASQNVRRFANTGHHELVPAPDVSEPWWSEDFVPGMCQFLLCEEAPSVAEILKQTFGMAAGVPGLFGPLWIEAQRLALRRGGDRAVLTHDDIIDASATPRVSELLVIAAQVSGPTPGLRFIDLPVTTAEACLEQPGQAVAAQGERSSSNAVKPFDLVAATRQNLNKQARAKQLQDEKRKEKNDHLGAEDLRKYECMMEAFAGLDGVQEPLLTGSNRAPPKLR